MTNISEQLICRMFEAEDGPPDLAKGANLTLLELARWASVSSNIALLEGLVRLADARAQILISRCRANAAARLIAMATDGEPSDLTRKACVDLLRTDLAIFPEHAKEEADRAPEAPVDEAAIRAALERLGSPGESNRRGAEDTGRRGTAEERR